MAGIRETLATIARARTLDLGLGDAGGDAGMTEVRGLAVNPGALRMLAHVPENLAPGAPLVVVLHGCTQRGGAYAQAAGWLALADRYGFAVLAPEQQPANNPNRCFNWFEPADTERRSGEAASIHAMVGHMVRRNTLDPSRVFVTGLSAGGAMTAALLAAYPETFAAGAVIAGLPFGAAAGMQDAFAAMRRATRLSGGELRALVTGAAPAPERWPRLAIWHGKADATVDSGNAQALARQWAAVHGVAEEPDEVKTRRGWTRAVWRGSDGEAIIECNVLAGLGHGTPLATGGDDPIGQVAPYMLEAGVSSSLEIARFWNLAPAATAPWAGPVEDSELESASAGGFGERVMASVSPHVPADVGLVISKALKAAGLMG